MDTGERASHWKKQLESSEGYITIAMTKFMRRPHPANYSGVLDALKEYQIVWVSAKAHMEASDEKLPSNASGI